MLTSECLSTSEADNLLFVKAESAWTSPGQKDTGLVLPPGQQIEAAASYDKSKY